MFYNDLFIFWKRNKLNKKKKNHNALLETIWTLIPCFFVLSFMFPSMALLYIEENIEKISLNTVNIIGNQWYWVYENNTYSHNYKFTSNLFLPNEYNKKYLNFLRLFETNEPLVIPIAIKTAFYITSNDVNHSWSVPGLGIKVDAIPGRINLKEITPTKIGMFSGMCSELCGVEHGFMPISLQIVTIKDWINNLGRNNINLDNFWFIG